MSSNGGSGVTARMEVKPLVLVLIGAAGGVLVLTLFANVARNGSWSQDVDQAMAWATRLLGLAGTLAGFLGLGATAALAMRSASVHAQATLAAGSLAGILAGATLLEVGGWPIPAALASIAIGTMTVLVRKNW